MRPVAVGLMLVPGYLVFAVTLCAVSALGTRLLGWRAPPPGRVADPRYGMARAELVGIGVEAGEGAQIGALSVVPKHTRLEGGVTYAGAPVAPGAPLGRRHQLDGPHGGLSPARGLRGLTPMARDLCRRGQTPQDAGVRPLETRTPRDPSCNGASSANPLAEFARVEELQHIADAICPSVL